MKTGFKRFRYTGRGALGTIKSGSSQPPGRHKGLAHPYLKPEFWLNPLNQFWNTAMYSEASKRYFNESITQ